MKNKTSFWWFILAAVAMVLATKSGWALLGTWALVRFATSIDQKLADKLSTPADCAGGNGSV